MRNEPLVNAGKEVKTESFDALERVEAACQRLAQAFVTYLDQARYDEVSALFTTDGVLHRVSGDVLRGRDAIEVGLRRPAGQTVIHHASPVHFTPTGADTATGTSSFLAFLAMSDDPSAETRVAAIWHDRYRREQGEWRIAERTIDVRMYGPTR
jgi:hypothetical protein